jgi:TRAP-type transport system periplasmic protein
MHKLLTVAAALAVAGSAHAADVEWNFASGFPDGNFHTRNITQFIEEVGELSGGLLGMTLHSNQSLFRLENTKRAVQTEQVPIGELLLVQFGNEDPLYEISAVPFLAETYERAEKLWQASREPLADRFARDGIRLLFGVPWPVQGFYANGAIESGADLQGVRFRSYSAMTARMAEELGALPTSIVFSEIPQAFATGLVSAMYTSPQTGIDTQAWDFTTHFVNVGGNFTMNVIIANERALQRLDAPLREAVLEAAARAEERGWRRSQEVTAEQIEVLKSHGIAVSGPTPQLLAELQAVGETLTAEWLEKAGALGEEIVARYRASLGE